MNRTWVEVTYENQVWMGPLNAKYDKRNVFLVLWKVEHKRYVHMALELETGNVQEFITNGLDEDVNWKRLA